MTKTKTFTTTPINSIGEARENFDWVYSFIDDKTVPLEKEEEQKEVQIVKYNKNMTTDEILADMNSNNLRPASPNELLGFVRDHINELEKYQWLVAASSVFRGKDGRRCFLCVRRRGGGRELSLVGVDGSWDAGSGWVFLAVALEPDAETLSLETLDTLTDEQCIEQLKKNGYKITKMIEKEF